MRTALLLTANQPLLRVLILIRFQANESQENAVENRKISLEFEMIRSEERFEQAPGYLFHD